MDWEGILANKIVSLEAYKAGKTKAEIARQYNIENVIKFASNESPVPLPDSVKDAILSSLEEGHCYPDYQCLLDAIADVSGVTADQVVLGSGSIDVIEQVFQLVSKQGKNIVVSQYGYASYPLLADKYGLDVKVALSGPSFSHQIDTICEHVDDNTALVVIDSPTNMAGSSLTIDEIKKLLHHVPLCSIVLIDQAYIEFTDACLATQTVKLLSQYPNLILTRTFSKSYGLAGLRVGYGLSNSEAISWIRKIQKPFPVSGVAVDAALAVLSDKQHLASIQEHTKKGKLYLTYEFRNKGFDVFQSEGNFILVDFRSDTSRLITELLKKGFILRKMESYGRPDLVRVSVSSMDNNEDLINEIERLTTTNAEVSR